VTIIGWKPNRLNTSLEVAFMKLPLVRGAVLLCFCATFTAFAQSGSVFEDRPALVLANDKIELTVITEGGAMAQILLAGDKEKINPLWNPYWIARQAGLNRPTSLARGHFVCLDGFGPASAEERAAGMPFHGEAYMSQWELQSQQKTGNTLSAAFSVALPLAHETFARTYHVVDGESIVWVDSTVTSLLSFDRPLFWAEHATVSAPFLEPGKVAVDMPVSRSKTKVVPGQANPPRQLPSFVDFTWPLAPTLGGPMFDLRTAPMKPNTTEHVTSLVDPSRRLGFVTALHPEKKLLIGWVFRREEFPWVQTWLSNPGPNRMTRGLEFSTQPFDLPRAEVLRNGPLFDSPVFRILPAKSTLTSNFLMFYTPVPDGFLKVDDVQLAGGKLVIEDRANKKTVTLAASRSL
jgi:hypothetical protein